MDPLAPSAVAALDEYFAGLFEKGRAPGLIYGVVADGRLIHTSSFGSLSADEERRPDERTVFRIASMTKSFTAATMLLLRDDGVLRLDDHLIDHLPETASMILPTTDSSPLTLRHVLTMSSGLAEDDPWADRQLHLDDAAMATLLRSGGVFARVPGDDFEYCNYGYAMLGRVIEKVTGRRYQDVVRDRILLPLGLHDTVFDRPDHDNVADGHRWEDERHRREDPLPDGAFASMGGLWSTLGDLATWVGFWCDAYPPRDDVDGQPVRRASRREAQQIARAWAPEASARDGELTVATGGYGMGLTVEVTSRLGTVVGHGGGLPGFGSHMRWWPDRGMGLVALANVTYAPMYAATAGAAALLVEHGCVPAPPRPSAPSVEQLGRRLGQLLVRWDDDEAATVFSDNVALDEDLERRRARAEALVARRGAPVTGPVRDDGRAAGEVDLHVEGGRVRVRFDLASAPPERVQRFEVIEAVAPPDPVRDAVDALLAGDGPEVTLARALVGPLRLGELQAHDGGSTVTYRCPGRSGWCDLTVTFDEHGAVGTVAGVVSFSPS